MTRAALTAVDIGDDEPVTLAEACRLFFGGRLSPSALRTEAAKGNLAITQIARKDFVTRRDIEEMKERCRRSASRPGYGSEPKPSAASSDRRGSSRTELGISGQDALRIKLRLLKEASQTTSGRNTSPNAAVVPLRSR